MFFDDERSHRLRPQILTELVSQYMNDAERAQFYGLPATCRVRERVKIISPENLTMGDHCWIGEGAALDASGGLEIGEHTSIGLNTLIFTHSSVPSLHSGMGSSWVDATITKLRICFPANPSICITPAIRGDSSLTPASSIASRAALARMSSPTSTCPPMPL